MDSTDMFENQPPVEIHERLLHSARNGDLSELQSLLQARSEGEIELDVSCKGKSKSNLGWTPLHLASYFGHKEVVELLLDHGADINAVNDTGDTPLHKASFIGREDLVLMLLERNADVNIHNGEGLMAREVCKDQEAAKLLWAAERTEVKRKEDALLAAARDGHIEILSQMLKDERPPNINCVDAQGNTCLHCAAYRGHKEAAVLLLQNGIDTTIKNIRDGIPLSCYCRAIKEQVLSSLLLLITPSTERILLKDANSAKMLPQVTMPRNETNDLRRH
ncbi:Oxysterol-binding protein- protein 1 [Homalodisca vitripennis]|nr:Oxysterol-binding protein- protein 1 [Homalodisca vitripennis]